MTKDQDPQLAEIVIIWPNFTATKFFAGNCLYKIRIVENI